MRLSLSLPWCLSVPCSLVDTSWERVDFLALWYVMLYCGFAYFRYGVLTQVWRLMVSIPDLYPFFLLWLELVNMFKPSSNCLIDVPR